MSEVLSHSEKDIYDGCIALMDKLVDAFYEYVDYLGVDVSKLDDEEVFEVHFSKMEIVRRLFLWHTSHSGGTSTIEKCDELGLGDWSESEVFGFRKMLEE